MKNGLGKYSRPKQKMIADKMWLFVMLWLDTKVGWEDNEIGIGPNHFYGFWPVRWVCSREAWKIYLLQPAKPKYIQVATTTEGNA